jgi:hypothetical protein
MFVIDNIEFWIQIDYCVLFCKVVIATIAFNYIKKDIIEGGSTP